MFLDSDDYYDLRAVEYLVDLRDKYDVDLVVTSIVEVRDHKINSIGESFSLENSKKLDKDEALVQMFYGNSIGTSPGGKLYKKDILLKYPYPEGMIYEDLAIAYEHIAAGGEIAVGFIHLYKYYRRPGSTVNAAYSTKLLDFYKAMDCNRSYVKRDFSTNQEMLRALNVRYVFNGFHIVHALLGSKMYHEVNKVRKEYIQYFKDVVPNPNVTRKNKLKYILFLVSAKLYKKVRGKMG